MEETKISKKFFISSLVILAVMHLGFLFYAVRHEAFLTKDSHEYLQQAENLKEGYGWYSGDLNDPHQPHLESRRPPLYAFFISLTDVLFKNIVFILITQNLLSLLNFATLFYLLLHFKFDQKIIGLLFLPLLFFPSQFIFSNMIMAEILFQTTIFWAFFFMIFFLLRGNFMLLVLHSIFLSLAILTKPVLYLFWLPEIFWFVFLFFRKKVAIPQVSISLIPLLTVIILSLYNEKKTGYFHYSSMKETNLMSYNAYQTLRLNYTAEEAKNILDSVHTQSISESSNFKQQSENFQRSAVEIIKNNLSGYLFLQLKGMINFFIDVGRHDMFLFFYEDFQESETGISYYYDKDGIQGVLNYLKQFNPLLIFYSTLILFINIIMLLALLFFIFNKNVSPEIRLFTILLIFYIAFVTGLIGSARFRVPVYPQLLFTVPFFMEYIKNSHFYRKLKW
ncbi:MAG: hypothetical protein ACR2GN_10935 [Bacteroidia bacterium]